MPAGVKPRSREAVRPLAQGFTRDDSPGEDEWWRRDSRSSVQPTKGPGAHSAGSLVRTAVDFVAEGAENAGHRGMVILAPMRWT
jgi:hypothetical protein